MASMDKLKALRAFAPAVPSGLLRPQGGGDSFVKLNTNMKFGSLASLLFTKTPQVKNLTFRPGAKHGVQTAGPVVGKMHALKTLKGSFR